MDKNLTWKIVFIVFVVALAAFVLYPPGQKLKGGIDLVGGTSLVYEIDAQGLSRAERRGLAERMITVLRRRIDPANIQNLVWRPQGDTRFEIQMPLASKEAQERREAYETALNRLLQENINPAQVLRALTRPEAERMKIFEEIAADSNEQMEVLTGLAQVYDERAELQKRRDELAAQMQTPENLIKLAGLDLEMIQSRLPEWSKLGEEQLKTALLDFLGSEGNVDLLTRYTKIYAEWAEVVNRLTEPETGLNARFRNAKQQLDMVNISEDQVKLALGIDKPGSPQQAAKLEELKAQYPNRVEAINAVVEAHDAYYPFRGRLDDPQDIQRMLKGAGILEFRILPTYGHPDVESEELAGYVETLRTKGPSYQPDNKYVWCEIEQDKADEWARIDPSTGQLMPLMSDKDRRPAVIADFGDKLYVLASNKKSECILRSFGEDQWKLERAAPGQDNLGRRAIDFVLDERGGVFFADVTAKNVNRPLCILLDGIAISAPNIETKIFRRGQITGEFSQTQVADMVSKLNAGSLPARLIEQPISVKTIGPSIGADNSRKGIRAGYIGLVTVIAIMLGYYLFAGAIADVALLMNLLFILGTMALLRATFTLPGIAGIILTIGMSVDANVLIFERIREEQQKGSSLRIAIRNGYERAFRAIFDSNLTTFITAAILLWVASEEIKGFAIVIMLGIISSMFTALFVTRVAFELLISKRLLTGNLHMLSIIRSPSIDWMKLRPVFITISLGLIAAGLAVFFTRNDVENNKYDIEFTGGTSVQINLIEPTTRQAVEDRFTEVASELRNAALAAANIYSIGESGQEFEITTTETNKLVTTVSFEEATGRTIEQMRAAVRKAQSRLQADLSNLAIEQKNNSNEYVVTTSQPNKSVVKEVLAAAFPQAEVGEPQIDEVVSDAILAAFGDDLEIQRNLEPTIVNTEKISQQKVDAYPELADYFGGVIIYVEMNEPATVEQLNSRLSDLRFKPDTAGVSRYPYTIRTDNMLVPPADQQLGEFVYASAMPEAAFRELSEDEYKAFVEGEVRRIFNATEMETSLPRVTQINPSVGAEAKTRAMIAIVLSLFAIIAYIWVRFGNVRYGIAAIAALIHDVCITLGAVTACTYIASTVIGETLLIGDFKINLAIIAAFLTLIGYSLNDTIIVFDRIRENRKKAQLQPATINDSINQTLSRTIMTWFTTFVVVLIMYIFGGTGLRGFTFAIGFGLVVGTYSSIAIAAPILLLGTKKSKG